MQASLAALGSLSGIIVWLLSSGITWLLGGLLLGAVIPFTFIVIFPVNMKLLDTSLDKNSEFVSELLSRWAKLHAVRSLLSLIAFMIFIVSLILAI
jgi:polyferredoxin